MLSQQLTTSGANAVGDSSSEDSEVLEMAKLRF